MHFRAYNSFAIWAFALLHTHRPRNSDNDCDELAEEHLGMAPVEDAHVVLPCGLVVHLYYIVLLGQ